MCRRYSEHCSSDFTRSAKCIPHAAHISGGQILCETCPCRWQAAAEAVARDCRAEQEALQQLRQPGSLPNADAARSLVRDIAARSQQHGSGAVPQELLLMVTEQCIEAGEQSLHARHCQAML